MLNFVFENLHLCNLDNYIKTQLYKVNLAFSSWANLEFKDIQERSSPYPNAKQISGFN